LGLDGLVPLLAAAVAESGDPGHSLRTALAQSRGPGARADPCARSRCSSISGAGRRRRGFLQVSLSRGSDTRTAANPTTSGSAHPLPCRRACRLPAVGVGSACAAAERDRSSRPRWPLSPDEIARAR
jgi:hypothetical protein